jgi:hypothetical protein
MPVAAKQGSGTKADSIRQTADSLPKPVRPRDVIRALAQQGPGQRDARQVALVDLPDDLLVGRDLQNAVAVARGDQRVAVGQSHCGETLVAEGFGAMPSGRLLAE